LGILSLLTDNYKRVEYIAFYFGIGLLSLEVTQMLNVPGVQDALAFIPLEAIGHWSNNLLNYEGAFPRHRELIVDG
jgi:hypothetical protein